LYLLNPGEKGAIVGSDEHACALFSRQAEQYCSLDGLAYKFYPIFNGSTDGIHP
jgi:hypothetical protein